MDFFEWLADELAKTDDEKIEIGFDEDTDLNEIIDTNNKGEKP